MSQPIDIVVQSYQPKHPFDVSSLVAAPDPTPIIKPSPLIRPSGFQNYSSVIAAELDHLLQITPAFIDRDLFGNIENQQQFDYREHGIAQFAEYLQHRLPDSRGVIDGVISGLIPDRLYKSLKHLAGVAHLVTLHLEANSSAVLKTALSELHKNGVLIGRFQSPPSANVLSTLYAMAQIFDTYSVVCPQSADQGRCYAVGKGRRPLAWIGQLPNSFLYSGEMNDFGRYLSQRSDDPKKIDDLWWYRYLLLWKIPSNAPDHLPPKKVCQITESRSERGGGRGRGEGRGRGRGEGRGRGRGGRGRGEGRGSGKRE